MSHLKALSIGLLVLVVVFGFVAAFTWLVFHIPMMAFAALVLLCAYALGTVIEKSIG